MMAEKLTTGGLGSIVGEGPAGRARIAQKRVNEHKRRPQETRSCVICGKPFECADTSTKKTCDYSCAERYHAQRQKERTAKKKQAAAQPRSRDAALTAQHTEEAVDIGHGSVTTLAPTPAGQSLVLTPAPPSLGSRMPDQAACEVGVPGPESDQPDSTAAPTPTSTKDS